MKTGITDFLRLSTLTDSNIRRSSREYLEGLLRSLMTTQSDLEKFRGIFRDPDTLLKPANSRFVIRALAELLELDRDSVTVKIVRAPATGFRHSPWSL